MASLHNPQIEGWFPKLTPADYEITSPKSEQYNCIAWALGQNDAWWEPASKSGYYWPKDAPLDDRIESLVVVFKSFGFDVCLTGEPESGFEKIAIYGEEGAFLHAARQIEGGRWTSKLGPFEDIEHKNLNVLTRPDPAYGEVVIFMRRAITVQPPS
jgi:hypothetical protein